MPTPAERIQQEAPYDALTLEDTSKLFKYHYATIVTVESKNGGLREYPNPDNANQPDMYNLEQFAQEFLSTYGSDNEYITCVALEMTPAVLRIDLGDTVTVRLPRFDLEAGKMYRVVGITYQLRERKITFNLWGGDTTPYVFSKSLGYTGSDEYWVYTRVENDGALPTGLNWGDPVMNADLQRPYAQYASGVQWQYICLAHKLTTRSLFPDNELVTHTNAPDNETTKKAVVYWYPSDITSTSVPLLKSATYYTGAATSPLWRLTVNEPGTLHICPKSNVQIKVVVTPNVSPGYEYDYTWQYIYWPPPSPDTRAYTGTEECWVYGTMSSDGWNQTGALSDPIVLYPEFEHPYPDQTSDFQEIVSADSPIYFLRKTVSRSGGVVVSESVNTDPSAVTTKWRPSFVGGLAPAVENVAAVDVLSEPSCLWRIVYNSHPGFLTINYGGNLELVVYLRMDPTDTWIIATWQYVYYDPTASPDPDPPNPPEFTVYYKGITESVTPTDTPSSPALSWGIAENVAATDAPTVNASVVTRSRQELVFATDTSSSTIT
jgi:hypothetical protein